MGFAMSLSIIRQKLIAFITPRSAARQTLSQLIVIGMSDWSHADTRVTELALAAGRGDRHALERFIAETQRDVWRFIAHRAGPAHADDLTQETYLRSLRSLARFEGRSSARTWLLSIARRVCVDEVRASLIRPRLAVMDGETAVERGLQPDTEDYALQFVEVKMMLAALSDQRREALILTQILGLSYTEAAAVCGCPVGTIRSRVARAREDLVGLDRDHDDRAIGTSTTLPTYVDTDDDSSG